MSEQPRGTVGRRSLLGGAATAAAGAAWWVGRDDQAAASEQALPYVGPCPKPVRKTRMPRTRELNVLVMGDMGSGSDIQYAVAAAARKLSRRTPIHLAINLGDNIYEMGASGNCAQEFIDKFEKPTRGLDVPWLMVQGNHDNSRFVGGDGGSMATGDHEVAYHRYSPRWYMPQRYYGVRLPRAAHGRRPVAEFIVLDENPLTSYLPQLEPRYAENGPYMNNQRTWLRNRLAKSKATWTFVLTHHPYRNNGSHGSAGTFDGLITRPGNGAGFKELIETEVLGKADFILSGHDHSMQLLNTGPTASSTQQIVCGCSGKTDNKGPKDTHPAFYQQFGKPGFLILQVRDGHVRFQAYTVDLTTGAATMAYQRTRKKR